MAKHPLLLPGPKPEAAEVLYMSRESIIMEEHWNEMERRQEKLKA